MMTLTQTRTATTALTSQSDHAVAPIPQYELHNPAPPQEEVRDLHEHAPLHRFLSSTGTVASSPDGLPCSRTCYGLLITLHQPSPSQQQQPQTQQPPPILQLEFVRDANQPQIHPNSYAPADFQRVQKLGGGGSGVAVFEGSSHPTLGDCVMKHGSDKDLQELFALATITRELSARGRAFQREAAARAIQQRIPEFKFIYISPHHLGEKRRALWARLVNMYKYSNNSWLLHPLHEEQEEEEEQDNTEQEEEEEEEDDTTTNTTSNWDDDSERFSFHNDQQKKQQQQQEDEDDEDDQNEAEMSFNILKQNSATAFQLLQQQKQRQQQQQQQHQYHQHINNQNQHHHRVTKSVGCQPQTQQQQPPEMVPYGVAISKSGTISGHRDIAVVAARKPPYQRTPRCGIQLIGDSLTIVVPETQYTTMDNNNNNKEDAEEHQHTRQETATTTTTTSKRTASSERQIQSNTNNVTTIRLTGMHGYNALKAIVDDLLSLMREHKWKVTLGQKRIGGHNPQTGNQWLYAGKLEGRLLDNLISQKIKLVRDLAALTTPVEQDPKALQNVLHELNALEEEDTLTTAGQLSNEADSFVGYSIKKNFKEDSGRFPVLMMMGKRFREHSRQRQEAGGRIPTAIPKRVSAADSTPSLILTKEEEVPAHHLGALTRPGALMGDTFDDVPAEPCFLDSMNPFYWRNLLHFAVRQRPRRHRPHTPHERSADMALKRIWTCGFTDAGLHNLFLTEDKLWLFDLGQPQLYSAPGFLTKFLFSFFHTLGMEEDPGAGGSIWVKRFVTNKRTGKLKLTKETVKLLSKAYDAFEVALDRLIDELFQGDDNLRWLLIQYVTMQLFSDASFCLQKWTIKGGGCSRSSNHQEAIEKWLWRALWDIYVAYDINSSETWSRLKVEHPSSSESMDMSPAIMRKVYGSTPRSSKKISSLSELSLSPSMLEELAIVNEEASHGENERSVKGLHLQMRSEGYHRESVNAATS